MDKFTAGTLALGGPALFLVVIWGASSSLYQTTSIPVAVPPSSVAAEPDDAAVAEEEAAEAEADADAEAAADATEAGGTDSAADAPVTEAAAPDDAEPAAEAKAPESAPAEAAEANGTESAPEEPEPAEGSAAASASPDTPTEATQSAGEAPVADAAPATGDTASDEPATEDTAADDLAAVAAAGDSRAGARVWRQCSACHVADQEQNRVGPHLVDVIGRPKASVEGFNYSDALQGLDMTWTVANLDAYITDPADYAPGNRMSFRGLADAEDRANVLAYLADLQLQE